MIGLQKKKKTVLFGIEHLFVFVFLFVWPFTGFINDDDESERGNICEVDEDHDDVGNHDEDADDDFDAKSKSGAVEERIFFSFLKPRIGLKFELLLLVLFLGV